VTADEMRARAIEVADEARRRRRARFQQRYGSCLKCDSCGEVFLAQDAFLVGISHYENMGSGTVPCAGVLHLHGYTPPPR
jgi:hypothetical protein